eukprot:3206030-Lingulodinium_polyedra.AAC.1
MREYFGWGRRKAPFFGAAGGAENVGPMTQMEVEERDLLAASEQDKSVPLASIGGGEAAAHPGGEAAIAEFQGNARGPLPTMLPGD